MCDMLNYLAEIDKDFEKIDVEIPHEINRRAIKLVFGFLYLISGALFFCDVIAYQKKMVLLSRKLLVLIYFIPLVANLRMGLCVTIFMGLVKQRFKKINTEILGDAESYMKFKNTYITYASE